MQTITTDEIRRNLAEIIRRVISGERFEVEIYRKRTGVLLVPRDALVPPSEPSADIAAG